MANTVAVTSDPTSLPLIIRREGDQVAWVVNVQGVVSTLTSPTMAFYKRGGSQDQSSTYLTGSMSVSGFTIITKSTTGLKQGDWVINVSATVDGQIQTVATQPLRVKRKSEP
jgi:hypothetical protein